MNFGSPEVFDLAYVPRWGIVRTIRQQSVAEHSYFVTLLFLEIMAVAHETVTPWHAKAALIHDMDELHSGDIPAPYKVHVNGPTCIKDSIPLPPKHLELLKIADLLEAELYLIGESRMGNMHVTKVCESLREQLELACAKMPLVLEYVRKTILSHWHYEGRTE
jgi:hypothetical protein